MAYEKTTWESGDVVTSAKLNNMEDGIENATPMMLVFDNETQKINYTWQQVHDAISIGRMVTFHIELGEETDESNYWNMIINTAAVGAGVNVTGGVTTYYVSINDGMSTFACSDPDDFPGYSII